MAAPFILRATVSTCTPEHICNALPPPSFLLPPPSFPLLPPSFPVSLTSFPRPSSYHVPHHPRHSRVGGNLDVPSTGNATTPRRPRTDVPRRRRSRQ